jgi:hypothetical protein
MYLGPLLTYIVLLGVVAVFTPLTISNFDKAMTAYVIIDLIVVDLSRVVVILPLKSAEEYRSPQKVRSKFEQEEFIVFECVGTKIVVFRFTGKGKLHAIR